MKAILFDLDGTLLPMDIEQFMKLYFYEMHKNFEDIMDMETLVGHVMKATAIMVKDTSLRTNEEVFMDAYELLTGADMEAHKKRWDAFYDGGYRNVKASSKTSQQMIESVRQLKEKGYQLVLVTNPLFPKYAITQRIGWAGLSVEDFDYVTSFEQNRYCKPQLKIYEEVLEHLSLDAKDCMMVGNDVDEDMIAGQLGMTTYLVTEHMLNRSDGPINVDHQGDYDAFLKYVMSLAPIQ